MEGYFDHMGKLTGRGKQEMWLEIIHQIKLFDAEELHLKPRPREPGKGSGDQG